ncbi:MAG: TraR/DksA family transcriptional regulator [Gammaproteobacteria bacterium]
MNQAELRAELEQKKTELSIRVDKIKADIGRGLDADSKEQAAQLENQEVLDGLANEAVDEIAKISAALKRMDEGVYGLCTKCGAEIDRRRLDARPHSSCCIPCAS